MGNTKSTCKVINEARYEIAVEVFNASDIGGEFALRKLNLIPGQQCSLPSTRKGLQLRISGNGKIQDLLHIAPGEIVSISKVQRGSQAHAVAAIKHPVDLPAAAPEAAPQAAPHIAPQAEAVNKVSALLPADWLDERNKYSKDELQQLLAKLKKESTKERRAEARQHTKNKVEQDVAASHAVDDLSAQIAALQRRNNERGYVNQLLENAQNSVEAEQDVKVEFEINTDTQSDELMAAINRMTSSRSQHTRTSSWDRAGQFMAHV